MDVAVLLSTSVGITTMSLLLLAAAAADDRGTVARLSSV